MASLIQITIDDDPVKAILATLKHRSEHLAAAMMDISEELSNSVVENFDEGGRPEKWKPLADATILGSLRNSDFKKKGGLTASAKKRVLGRKILMQSTRLRKSIHAESDDVSAMVVAGVPYAAIHHFGGEAGRKSARVKIPARPFMIIQPEDVEYAKETILDYLTRD